MTPITFQKTHPDAKAPFKASIGAAGYDLHSIGFSVIRPGERRLIRTGLTVTIPPGYYGRIAPRSGLALKYGIDVLAGVIDSDYRQEIGVVLINFGAFPFNVEPDMRIAQLIIEPCLDVKWTEGELVGNGRGGFGSTGV